MYKNVWRPYKGGILIAQPDNRDEAQGNVNTLLAVTRKTMMDQKSWLAMCWLSFQAYFK